MKLGTGNPQSGLPHPDLTLLGLRLCLNPVLRDGALCVSESPRPTAPQSVRKKPESMKFVGKIHTAPKMDVHGNRCCRILEGAGLL